MPTSGSGVHSGQSATGIIPSGVFLVVLSGGVASATTLESNAAQYDYGVAISTQVLNGAVENLSAGGTSSDSVISQGGTMELLLGGTAISTVVDGGTIGGVMSGGVTSNVTLENGGGEGVASAGSAFATVVRSGSFLYALNSGVVSGTQIDSGGYELVSSAGTAVDTFVLSGGSALVSSGGVVFGVTLQTSGTLELQNGSVVQGGVVFAATSGGMMRFDGAIPTGFVVSDFAVGDSMVLASEPALLGYDASTGIATFAGGQAIAFDPATAPASLDYDAATGLLSVPCFLRGTQIATPDGEQPVETLRPGDPVVTITGAVRKLRWIGAGRTLVTPRNRERATPVVVRRGALADNVPHRDLYLTRGHSLFLDGVLIPVEELVNHRSIAWVESARVVEFYHPELDSHDVILAEGAAAETFRDDANSPLFHNAATRPATPPMPPCAPVLHEHPTVKRIWRRISDRAGRPAQRLTGDADLHLLADGIRLDAEAIEDRVVRFRLPGPVAELRIVSRSVIPAMLGSDQDQRRLGVALRRIAVRQPGLRFTLDWPARCLTDGFHGAEPGPCHRWTNGSAGLPPDLLAPLRAGATLDLHVVGMLRYPADTREAHGRSAA